MAPPTWPQLGEPPNDLFGHIASTMQYAQDLKSVAGPRNLSIPFEVAKKLFDCIEVLGHKVIDHPNTAKATAVIQDHVISMHREIVSLKGTVERIQTTQSAAPNSSRTYATVAGTLAPTLASTTAPSRTAPKLAPQRAITVRIPAQEDRDNLRKLTNTQLFTKILNILANCPTKALGKTKLVSTNQLKSGDIMIYTATPTEMETLHKYKEEWTAAIGKDASLNTPTYGVLAHGIAVKSMQLQNQEETIACMEASNRDVMPNIKITRINWLGRQNNLKKHATAVVEFEDPTVANAAIDNGLVWEHTMLQVERYDRNCRLRHCFRCQKYGHIGTQCRSTQTCGFCSKDHRTQECPTPNDNSTHCCANCKGKHTAWSPSCEARKAEGQRVTVAKAQRAPYHQTNNTPTITTTRPRGRPASSTPFPGVAPRASQSNPRPAIHLGPNPPKRARQSSPGNNPPGTQTRSQTRTASIHIINDAESNAMEVD